MTAQWNSDTGPWGSILIDNKEFPEKMPRWNTEDIASDEMPTFHFQTKTTWWSIEVNGYSDAKKLTEILKWCETNIKYKCAVRFDDWRDTNQIIAFFAHPDDAMVFKLTWT